MKKPTKTISGVAPVAVMIPPGPCPHGACVFCPTLKAPQSYTPESPAVLRAKSYDYDPYKQTKARIKMLKDMGHPVDKIELIIMGGTFLALDKEFKYNFIKRCYDAMNGKTSKTLDVAKKLNEKAKYRCVALCIETRPDYCSDKEISEMLEFGATRVELGVQAVDDKIYRLVNRGHTVKDVIDSTKRLKEAGFKVGYHLMPGIYGSNPKKDLKLFKKIFSSSKYKPDQIKIYPCQVLRGSELEKIYWDGKYKPYTKPQVADLIIRMLKLTPRYCRIMRILREIPLPYLVCGIKHIDMRKDIEEQIRKDKKKINEIRFREIGFAVRDQRKINLDLKLKVTKYTASGGKEYFLEIVNKDDLLFGLLRLRLDKTSMATVRELHVYGPALELGRGSTIFDKSGGEGKETKMRRPSEGGSVQHIGLGKRLLEKAEEISQKRGKKKVRVISGVGVREYYRKLGYELDNESVYVENNLR